MSPRARGAVLGALIVVISLAGGCGSDDGDAPAGHGSAQEVIDAHLTAMRTYDLAAACELMAPQRREEMAAADGAEVDGYCERATREVMELASEEDKARTRELYTTAEVSEVERDGGTWFSIEAPDGSYHEEVQLVEVDGRWWVEHIESTVEDEHGH